MLVMLGFYKRRPDLTHEQFSHHWRTVHGPLIRGNPDMTRLIRRYVQHHLLPRSLPLAAGYVDLGYDGFSEIWLDGPEAIKQMRALPWMKEVLVEDERKFLDMTATRASVVDQQSYQLGGAPPLAD
jgi:hypothetical protein